MGAIPYRTTERGFEVLLVTSRGTGKWIFPKGGVIAGLNEAQSAAQEALEEAGVVGNILRPVVGHYFGKSRGGVPSKIRLFLLEVEQQLEQWPEQDQRKRRWVTIEEAAQVGLQPELVCLAEQAGRRIAGRA